MNAAVMSEAVEIVTPRESAREAASRFAKAKLSQGFKAYLLHRWREADGTVRYFVIRLKHPDTGEKWVRPMYLNEAGEYVLEKPPAPENGGILYNLPALLAADPETPLFIVEGEGCADELMERGILATTSGSSSSADKADWTPAKRFHDVRLWPDNDAAGMKYAADVAEKLQAQGCTVHLVADEVVQALPDKGDAVDWLREHPDATAADILALRTVPVQGEAPAAPEPLRRPVPKSEPYPVGELGKVLGDACKSVQRVIQAPDAVCAASILAAASLATQGLANVELDGRTMPLSLWLVTVAESGERKSAVDSEAMRAARERERVLAADYAAQCIGHEAELAEWQARREAAKAEAKKAKGAGLADKLRTLGRAPEPPLQPLLMAADFTAEGLAKLLAAGLPSVGAFTDEAALVFGGHGMTKETTARTAGTLSKLWDSGTLDRIRSGDGATKLYGKRLALHLMAQPVIAERALSDDVLSGQGFLARCLLAWPESTAGHRPYRAESLRDDEAMARYTATLAALHARPLPLAEGTRNELQPPALTLTSAAFEAWRAVHDVIEGATAPGGRYATVKPWASKAPEQCLRIAGVLALVENAERIEQSTIERAAELALWHLNEAVRLAGVAETSREVRDAEALLDWCHVEGKQYMHSSEALQYGPARIRERSRLLEAIGELERAGWAERIEDGMELDGKQRRNVWRITKEVE